MGEQLVEIPMEVLLLATGIILLLFLIVLISFWVKLNKLRKNYTSLLNGSGEVNVEEVLIGMQDKGNRQTERIEASERSIQAMQDQLRSMKSHIGIHRYNAFAESGSDLSFSVAVLDEKQDGVVLTGIHSRDHTYVYAKPIEQGQSSYTLSPEEKEAITRSVPKK
ncbi:DUF4446 family protein [Paenibacillus cremeus]|uniref:DUF4446 family protein n=1 Tax=Paenibacillus cremeus TaxID=2163881 RepID=A0A559KF01_9BACL|nr:DUF4446 family protein [Paenibacillus cremeus]TVY10705.1 DUF4446 family protein [Paenibacillus cremeus]